LEKLSYDKVKVKVIHGAVGSVTESDVMLASASNAIIIGFNVRPEPNAKKIAEKEKVDIRTYRVIYNVIDDIELAMKGMLEPSFREAVIGRAEVRATFKVPGVGIVAGCYVLEGQITRNSLIRVIRDGIIVYEGQLDSLKRFKDDVKEVNEGYECGIGLEKFNDIKEGDILEAVITEKVTK
jgi:translation initiation factor IF-2